MANVINATSTGNGGLISTGDDSGVLNIQTNETTALSINASQNVTFTNAANLPNTFGFKNRIINGRMEIDQRNAGASVTQTTSPLFVVDRFAISGSVTSKFTAQRSTTAPANFINSVIVTSSSAYTVGSGESFQLRQAIEGFNVSDLNWGTANAKTVTLSFWVRSSLTGTFGGAVGNNDGNRSYPFSYTISSANTFEYKTVTITGDTTGTWLTNTSGGLWLYFGLGAGSTKSGTAGAWAAADYRSVTGATSVVGTNGATWYITGVQLELGSAATSFDMRPYGTELQLCQRYYFTSLNNSDSPSSVYAMTWSGATNNGSNFHQSFQLPVTMRVIPDVVWVEGTSANFPATDPTFSNGGRNSLWGYKAANGTSASGYWIGNVKCTAEL